MTELEPLVRTAAEVAEDEEFFRRYGAWAPLDPPALREFMAGVAEAMVAAETAPTSAGAPTTR